MLNRGHMFRLIRSVLSCLGDCIFKYFRLDGQMFFITCVSHVSCLT
jgi:hypothetical protein